MANYILGDVMIAKAYVTRTDKNNKTYLAPYFEATTMTDSTINISTTAEEIRGGWGNQLLGKIFHDSNFGVNLTEAMWSLDYLAAQIGTEVSKGDGISMETVMGKVGDAGALTLAEGATLKGEIAPMFANATAFCGAGTDALVVWVKDCNDKVYTYTATKADEGDTYTFAPVDETNVPAGTTASPASVCITYPLKHATNCEQIIVNAAYEPAEFSLFLYGKLFAGNGCSKSKSRKVGQFTIEIPRFQLDGTVDLTMNPSSAATTSLNGSALAYGCTCGGDPEYAKITVVLDK